MRYVWMALGMVSLVLGVIGIVLPILPTTPLLLLTAFCFAKSSERLHTWFLSTKLYQKHLDSFVKDRSMTVKTKVSIMTTVTILMGIGYWFMDEVPVARAILAVVWIFHVWYFVFRIKTVEE